LSLRKNLLISLIYYSFRLLQILKFEIKAGW